jgi:serine/threonine protein kinase
MEKKLDLAFFETRFKDRTYIGSGGFAKVYKAFDHAQNRYVALKISDVRPEWNKFILLREVDLVNELPFHPNIPRQLIIKENISSPSTHMGSMR